MSSLRFLTWSQVLFPLSDQSPSNWLHSSLPETSQHQFCSLTTLFSAMTLLPLSPSSFLIYLKIPSYFCLLHLGQISWFILKPPKMGSQSITFYVLLFSSSCPSLKSGWLISKHALDLFLGVCSLHPTALLPSQT